MRLHQSQNFTDQGTNLKRMVWFPNQALESTQRHDRSSRQTEERKSESTTDEDELKGVAGGVKDEIVEKPSTL